MLYKKIILFLTFIILILSTTYQAGYASENKQSFTFGVVPQFTPEYIHQSWDPILKELSKRLNITFELKTYKSIPEFERAFLEGKLDFAFVNPYHAVMAKRAQGYIPILRDKSPLVGIIVVRKDAPYRSILDLKEATIAFPAPNAFAASLYMRAILTEKFKLKFTPKYVKTHDNVYRHVVLGLAQAGGGVNQTFLRQPQEVKEQLRILYETPGSAPHPIIVHPRVPKAIKEAFIKNFLQLSQEKDYSEFFYKIQLPEPILAEYKRDYKPLEKLKLDKYVVLEEN